MSTDASTIRSLVGDALALVVQNMATIASGLVISFTANWILALIILAVSPLLVMQGYLQAKFLKGFSADAKVSLYDLSSRVFSEMSHWILTISIMKICRLCMKKLVKWQTTQLAVLEPLHRFVQKRR